MRDPDIDGPDRPVKEMLSDRYFKPYLRVTPSFADQEYLLNLAWKGFLLRIGTAELRAMGFVQWMCSRLAQRDEQRFAELFGNISQEDFDNVTRVNSVEKRLSENAEDQAKWLITAMELYKTYFESEFRLWATVPYCFVSKTFGQKTNREDPINVVHVGASEKYQAIKNVKIDIPQGDIRRLVEGFDNNIRNAGAGHDHWELSDKGTIVLSVRDPKTGEERRVGRIELGVEEVQELLTRVRRTLWILRMGATLFSINRPDIARKTQRTKEVKIKEIEFHVAEFARGRCFEITEFHCSLDRKTVDLSLKYRPKILGVGGAVYFGTGEKHDVISVESEEPYTLQVMGVVEFMLKEFFKPEVLPIVRVRCFDAKSNPIGDARFESAQLARLFLVPKEFPAPSAGALPGGNYVQQGQIRVPYGRREEYIELMKKRVKPNVRILG